ADFKIQPVLATNDYVDSLLEKDPFLTDQVNWRILLSTREYLCLAKISRVVPAWVSFGITTYLGLCGPTGRQSSMYIDMIRVIRRGPRISIVLVLPPGEGKGRRKLASDREGSVTCHMGTQFCFRTKGSGFSWVDYVVADVLWCRLNRDVKHNVQA
uniref:Uncharacterized protein n=1 Tax=Cucumis melo TaxID=3656 RepID=A0A9I9E8C5_CUCME